MGSDPAWHALHPASVVVNLVPRAWQVSRTMWPILLALVWGSTTDVAGLVDATLVLAFFAVTVGATVLHWATLRYRIVGTRLEIRTGLLHKQVRTLDAHRVQNTELVRNLFHRLSGLVEVRIETASGHEVEGLLSALTVEDAEALVAALDAARQRSALPTEEQGIPLVTSDLLDLVRLGLTTLHLGTIAVVMGVIVEGLQWAEPDVVEHAGGLLRGAGAAGLLVAVLSGTWLWGVVIAVLRFYRFRLLHRTESLVAEGGLLTRRKVELPLGKVQLVTAWEPLVRRWAGIGSLRIETAAARLDQGGTTRASATVPVIPTAQLFATARTAIPSLVLDPWTRALEPPHPHSLLRGALLSALEGVLFVALITLWAGPWGLLSVLGLPLLLLRAWLDYRSQGWLLDPQVVIARRGWWNRRTAVVARDKVQSVSLSQGPMRRRWGLARLHLRVAGSSVSLPDMDWERATALLEELKRLPTPAAAEVASPTRP